VSDACNNYVKFCRNFVTTCTPVWRKNGKKSFMQLSEEQRRRAYRLLEEQVNRMIGGRQFDRHHRIYNILLDKLSKGNGQLTEVEINVVKDLLG
jgi:hypothetical protein